MIWSGKAVPRLVAAGPANAGPDGSSGPEVGMADVPATTDTTARPRSHYRRKKVINGV